MSTRPPTERGEKFADWFHTLLPETVRLAPSWRATWARCFDDLVRLDRRAEAEIAKVCQWARGNDFWQQNFLSPVKLRQRDRQGVMFYDRFLAAMNPAAARRAVAATREYVTERRKEVVE